MLSFAEEICLLALDEESGKFTIPSKDVVLHTVLIGAALIELSFLKRIDTDQDDIHLLDSTPTGNSVLDTVLDYVTRMNLDGYKIYHCLKILTPKAKELEEKAINELLKKKILEKVDKKFLWISAGQRYPVIDNKKIENVETRLKEIILSDEIPEPREAVLISLVHACDLFKEILSPKELTRSKERIENLSKLELVSREILNQISHARQETVSKLKKNII